MNALTPELENIRLDHEIALLKEEQARDKANAARRELSILSRERAKLTRKWNAALSAHRNTT
jgi:hypothetical protein